MKLECAKGVLKYVKTRDEAVRQIVYHNNFQLMRDFLNDTLSVEARAVFNTNTERQKIAVMEVMARKLMYNISNFSPNERKMAEKWLHSKGCDTTIDFKF